MTIFLKKIRDFLKIFSGERARLLFAVILTNSAALQKFLLFGYTEISPKPLTRPPKWCKIENV
jgi:hypothetical protein